MVIKVIHTADVHFGMENYGKIDPQSGIHSRLLDFNRAFNECIDYALAEKVDVFLFAGDAYKTAHPSPTQQRLMMQSLLRLFREDIPVVMVIGNHDNPLSFGKAHALEIFHQMPIKGFHVIAQPSTLHLETRNGPLNIVGIPWPSRTTVSLQGAHAYSSGAALSEYISSAVSSIIAQLAAELDPTVPAILAGHLTVSSGIFSGSEKRAIYGTDPIFLPSQLAVHPFDYVALGHLHRYQNLNPHGYPAVVYSGSIDRVDFGERKETKGFCLVKIPEKGAATHEFIPVATRPFIQIEVTLVDNDLSYTEQLLQALKKYELHQSIVKIIYHLPPHSRERVDITAVQNACAEAQHLVGIIPVRHTSITQPRNTRINHQMDITKLLDTYFESKPELLPHKERLMAKALAILKDYDAIQTAAPQNRPASGADHPSTTPVDKT